MTQQQTPFIQVYKTAGGKHVTVEAMSLRDALAFNSEIIELIELMGDTAQGKKPEGRFEMLDRYQGLIRRSLTNPKDADHLKLVDVEPLLDLIWTVNGLGELIKKELSRALPARELRLQLLESS